MSNFKIVLRKSIFYLLSVCLLSYTVISIGISNIFHALISADIKIVLIALFLNSIAIIFRLYKFQILLNHKDRYSIFEIFISSRIGKEISFAGFFLPLFKKSNRNDGTLQNLILDRYTEIFSTLILAFISCFFILKKNNTSVVILFVIGAFTLIMLIVPFIKVAYLTKKVNSKLAIRIIDFIMSLQERLKWKSDSGYILWIYVLSVFATIFDFLTALFILKAYHIHVNFFLIPVIWAVSGLVSILAFMIIGSTEVSVIYLYYLLAGINKAITTSFVIVSRFINIMILTILLFGLLIFKNVKKSYRIYN